MSRKKAADQYAVKNGHPPVAKGVVCVDFDATLFPWGRTMFDDTPPFEGAVEALQAFDQAGLTIVIFTSRFSPGWWTAEKFTDSEIAEQMTYVENRLRRWDIPYSRITAEKVPAIAYIDDKAVEFRPHDNNWAEIAERILR